MVFSSTIRLYSNNKLFCNETIHTRVIQNVFNFVSIVETLIQNAEHNFYFLLEFYFGKDHLNYTYQGSS